MATKRSYSAKSARAGKDLGKRGKNFSKIEAKAGKNMGRKPQASVSLGRF